MRIELKPEEKLHNENEQGSELKENDQNARLKNMTAKQRMRWLFDYYKFYVIIPLVVIVVLIIGINTFLDENKEQLLHITMVNAVMEDPEMADESLGDAFKSYYLDLGVEDSAEIEKLEVGIDTGILFPKDMNDAANTADTVAVTGIQKYVSLLESKKTDVTLANVWVIDQLEKADAYMPLDKLLDKEQINELEKKGLIYSTYNSDHEKVAVGIRVDSSEIINKFYQEECILAFTANEESKRAKTDGAKENYIKKDVENLMNKKAAREIAFTHWLLDN